MDKIYMDAKDQNIASTMVYVRKTDNLAHKIQKGFWRNRQAECHHWWHSKDSSE